MKYVTELQNIYQNDGYSFLAFSQSKYFSKKTEICFRPANEWIGGVVSIISGDGKGQTQVITDNATNTITVTDWDTTLGDPAAGSRYSLAYTKGGSVIVNVRHSDLIYGGFKVLGMNEGGYTFKVSPIGEVQIVDNLKINNLEIKHYQVDITLS